MPIRAVVLYEREPDPARYQQHIEQYMNGVPGATFRHGRVARALMGDPQFAYYAELEWADRGSAQEGFRSEVFRASGRDAMEMGIPFTIHMVEME